MISFETFGELYAYNYWARDAQVAACAALSEEQFLRPMGSSFSSVRDTLAHIMGSEWLWLERWLGRSPRTMPRVPEGLSFAETMRRWQEQFTTAESIQQCWRVIETDLRGFLATLDDQALARELRYTNLQGKAWNYSLWRTLLHVVTHGTYHRGQVTTLLRQLGAKAAEVDFLAAHDAGLRF